MKRLLEKYQIWWREHLPQLWVILCIVIAITIHFTPLSLYEGVQILLMVTLVLVTWWYASETAEIRRANKETVERIRLQSERPYIVGLIKSAVQSLEAELDGLIDRYGKRKFDWQHVNAKQLKTAKVEIENLELLRTNNDYYIPWPPFVIGGLLGRVPSDSDTSYYAYLLERNRHLRELIEPHNPQAESLWTQLCELTVILANSDLGRAVQELLTSRRQEFNSLDEEFSRFKQAAQECCLYLASSKLLMESEAYAELMAINWSGWKDSATWSFWRNWQDNLMKNIIEDRSVKQLQATILEKSETLANDVRSIKDEVLKIKKNYVWRYNILPEEIELLDYPEHLS